MSISTTLMRPGSGELRLLDETPFGITARILELIDTVGCHLVILPNPIDLEIGDAGILAAAKAEGHTMRIMTRPERTAITFAGPATWMDSSMETELSKTAGTPTAWVTDLLAGTGLTLGTVSGGTNVTHTFKALAQTKRGALDIIAGLGGFEYRVNADFTVDIGTNLFRSPPIVVITDRAEGPDGEYIGLLGSIPAPNVDASNPATKVLAAGQGAGGSIVFGEATQSIPLLRWDGVAATFVQVINAPSQTAAGADAVATSLLPAFGAATRSLRVSTSRDRSDPVKGYGPKGEFLPGSFQRPGTTLGDGDAGSGNRIGDLVGRGGIARNIAASAAARAVLRRTGNRRTLTAPPVEAPYLHRFLRVGDEVYVYDLVAGITDTAEQIHYRGETINPARLRVTSIDAANEEGCGWYIRPNGTTVTPADYLDISAFVIPEEPGAEIGVSDWTPSSSGVANRADPALESRISASPPAATGPYTPTLTGMATGSTGAVNTADYVYVGGPNVGDKGILSIWATHTFGTAGVTFPTNPFISLPDGFEFDYDTTRGVGFSQFLDSSTPANNRYGLLTPASATVVRPIINGITAAAATLTTTTPFTWAAGDTIAWQLLGAPVVRV